MSQFFQANVAIDLQLNEEGLERYANLSQAGFSENKYILLQTALVQYHARGNLSWETKSLDSYSQVDGLKHSVLNLLGGVWNLTYRAELLTVEYYSSLTILFLVLGKMFTRDQIIWCQIDILIVRDDLSNWDHDLISVWNG